MEIELKYRLHDAASGERFLTADSIGPFRAISGARTAQHEDRYLDTSDGALARAGFAARLRQTNAGTIVGVKSTRSLDGPLARREELEGPADRTSDPRDWPPSDARSLILELCGDAPLVELVTVRQLRRRRRLKAADAAVELSLDEVDVVARGRVIDRFAELEVELTAGEEERLTELRAVFEAQGGLTPATSSKLETALAASSQSNGTNDGRATGAPAANGGEPIDPNAPEERAASAAGVGGPDTRPPEQASASDADSTPRVPSAATARPEKPSRSGERRRAADRRRLSAGGRSGTAASALPEVEKPTTRTPRLGEPASAEPEPLVVGKTAGVLAEDTIAEAGRKVLRFHLARMLAREAGTRSGTDPEDLHSMRVATRRMRAAWRIFGEGFRPGRTKRYRTRLREVAGRLGAVRDLDVLIEAGEKYMGSQSRTEQLALQPLFAAWRAQRDDARRLLVLELDTDGYARWVDDFRDFVRTDGAGARPVSPTEPHRIRDTAPSSILRSYEQVRAYEAVLRWADVATLHELRIAAKWLRYGMEFVRECLGPEASGLIARVVALQDHLGMLHDADVAASMARAFLVERAGRLSETESAAIGRYLVDRERELARLRRTVGRPWRQIAGLTFRRSLGRTLAAL